MALALGIARIDVLLDQLSATDLAEWMEFYKLEPWGDERADYRAGVVASVVANIHRGKDVKPFKPLDFMPFVEKKHGC